MTKQYPEIDSWEQLDKVGGYYCRHVAAMTDEGLHSKSDIARQLGWRDRQIDELRKEVELLRNGIGKALDEIEDDGPKALKYASQELRAAIGGGA